MSRCRARWGWKLRVGSVINNYIQSKWKGSYTYHWRIASEYSTLRHRAKGLPLLNYKRISYKSQQHLSRTPYATYQTSIILSIKQPSTIRGRFCWKFRCFWSFQALRAYFEQFINIPITMNRTYLLLAALLVSAAVLYTMDSPSASPEASQYLAFLSRHGKAVPKGDELLYRSKIYSQFLRTMQRHNSDPSTTWQMGENQFSDLTQEEFVRLYLGEMSVEVRELNQAVNVGFQGEIDWRNKGIVTKVKNQGQCGSCWAFGATAAHESYQVQFKNQPNTIDLSEQQLVDCSTGSPYENNGCNGGYGVRALEYIKDNGQTTQAEYPYTAKNGNCKTPIGSYRPFGVAEGHGCDEIEEIIARRPMAVRVDASNWSPYRSGIFSNCAKNINHAVFLVGSSETAWTIKNSWGPTWGENGFIRIAKGDTCAVCQGPSFAI